MMEETWEKRWFGKGAIPLILQQWSEENSFTTQPVRTDYYLMNSSNKNTGIKWREGNMQVKELIDMPKPGIEHYKKWSFSLKEDESNFRLSEREEWLGVTKKREMLKFETGTNGIRAIEMDEPAEKVCQVEISAILCRESLWWTAAYEANYNVEILEHVLNLFPIPDVENAECIGYAEWLTKNFKNGY